MNEEDAARELDGNESKNAKTTGARNGAASSKDGRKPR